MRGNGDTTPGYIALHENGLLARRAGMLDEASVSCVLCPRRCGIDRKAGEIGPCGVGHGPKTASMNIHRWEEPPISGTRGSGTVFFSGCSLKCVFCQNYPISQMGVGRAISVEELAKGMVRLQKSGVHNINLVTPTHQAPAFVRALLLAVPMGLDVPIVYNTSGYETLETLRLLDGIVDIYLPDIKYDDSEAARFCSGRRDYVEHNRAALLEMWRQTGPLVTDADGIARKGMLVRHMVLPGGLSGVRGCLEFLARELGREVSVSLMNQYFPAHKAFGSPPLDRKTTREEYAEALALLDEFNLENGFVQDE